MKFRLSECVSKDIGSHAIPKLNPRSGRRGLGGPGSAKKKLMREAEGSASLLSRVSDQETEFPQKR